MSWAFIAINSPCVENMSAIHIRPNRPRMTEYTVALLPVIELALEDQIDQLGGSFSRVPGFT